MNLDSGIVKEEAMKLEEEYEEPMDTNETPGDAYFEEGEIYSSEDEKNTNHFKSSISNSFTRNVNKTSNEGLFGNLNISAKDEAMKKLDRAKRFALPVKTDTTEEVYKEQLSNLYRDLGIDKENERHYRFNTIHMRGTENMSTEDVLEYFDSYSPSHIEWINDTSCNIVWMDDVSAAQALLKMSKKIINLDKVHLNADPFEKDLKEIDSNKDETIGEDKIDARKIKAAIPPGFWRFGAPSDKSEILLLRYATRSDKKQKNAEKNSEYYKKYGNPNFGNLPGILSKSFRGELKKHKQKKSSIWERSQDNSDQNNPWGDLAYEWGKKDKVENVEDYLPRRVPQTEITQRNRSHVRSEIPDLRISLTNRKERGKRQRSYSESSLNYSDEWEGRRSKIPRMKMYADDEEKKVDKSTERKQASIKTMTGPVEDLRSKINRKKNRTRLRFKSEKQSSARTDSETSDSENEYVDGDSGDWALEHYKDLRQSLEQNKKHDSKRLGKYQSESESDEDDENDYYQNLGRRSPLQIQIENDEYYHRN